MSAVLAATFYSPISSAAAPLFGWSINETEIAGDGSKPPPIVLPNDVRPPLEPSVANAPETVTMTVENGDTLASILGRAAVSPKQAHTAIEALREVYNPRRLQIGQEIMLTVSKGPQEPTLVGLELSSRFDRYAGITLYPDGGYRSFETAKRLTKVTHRVVGSIENSLFVDGINAGAPAGTMADFLRLFSFDIDFERDVKTNDKFELVFEQYLDRDGAVVHTGDVRFAGLTVGGTARGYYRYDAENGDDAYYDISGQGIRKALLRTPVDGARRSSGFGMRRHPILGYTKMHKGVDFAAPRGTPIRAAGDGVLTFVGTKNGYGRYISIRHNGDYTTAYAHMHRFAKGMKQSKRVKQGQVIGYVGSTGRSTGPHLHYEVLYKRKHVNPSKLRLPSGKSLKGRDLVRFRSQVADINAIREDSANSNLLAARPE